MQQINLSKQIKDEFWKKIVQTKIINQGLVLKILKYDSEIVSQLQTFANTVQCGDITNREGHAAKVYFNTLMGTSFSRGDDNILINSGLNYGYAIIRSLSLSIM